MKKTIENSTPEENDFINSLEASGGKPSASFKKSLFNEMTAILEEPIVIENKKEAQTDYFFEAIRIFFWGSSALLFSLFLFVIIPKFGISPQKTSISTEYLNKPDKKTEIIKKALETNSSPAIKQLINGISENSSIQNQILKDPIGVAQDVNSLNPSNAIIVKINEQPVSFQDASSYPTSYSGNMVYEHVTDTNINKDIYNTCFEPVAYSNLNEKNSSYTINNKTVSIEEASVDFSGQTMINVYKSDLVNGALQDQYIIKGITFYRTPISYSSADVMDQTNYSSPVSYFEFDPVSYPTSFSQPINDITNNISLENISINGLNLIKLKSNTQLNCLNSNKKYYYEVILNESNYTTYQINMYDADTLKLFWTSTFTNSLVEFESSIFNSLSSYIRPVEFNTDTLETISKFHTNISVDGKVLPLSSITNLTLNTNNAFIDRNMYGMNNYNLTPAEITYVDRILKNKPIGTLEYNNSKYLLYFRFDGTISNLYTEPFSLNRPL